MSIFDYDSNLKEINVLFNLLSNKYDL